jgi:CubicO group peptidase (beta-lactamase class C family)
MDKRWYFLLAIPVVLGIIVSAGELREIRVPDSIHTPAELEAYLDSTVPGLISRYRLPGVCMGIVGGNSDGVLCYGAASSETGRPLDGSSRLAVASVSKTFTALGVLTLAARGLVDLDAPVERYLGTWRFPESRYDASAVTARRLLSHTAGTNVQTYGGMISAVPAESTRDVLDGRSLNQVPVTLTMPPGSGFRYSGGGYMVAQLLIEEVSGMPFERYMKESVFLPLGMRDSSFSWGSMRDADTRGHDAAGRVIPYYPYGAAMAAGGMVTTGNDMLEFLEAFRDSRIAILLGWPGGMWERYLEPVIGVSGMGIMVSKLNGHTLIGHGGTTMGYNAGYTVLQEESFGWFVLANGNGGVFLESDLDPVIQEWKTGYRDPQYCVIKLERCVVAFLAVMIPGFGVFFFALFLAGLVSGRRWAGTAGISRAKIILRYAPVPVLAAVLALWSVFFHTNRFYPAFFTAWLPAPFSWVTLGIGLFILRMILSCAFPRSTAGRRVPQQPVEKAR